MNYVSNSWRIIVHIQSPRKISSSLWITVIERRWYNTETKLCLVDVFSSTHDHGSMPMYSNMQCTARVTLPWLHSNVKVDRRKFHAALRSLAGRNSFITVKLSGDRMLLRYIGDGVVGSSSSFSFYYPKPLAFIDWSDKTLLTFDYPLESVKGLLGKF